MKNVLASLLFGAAFVAGAAHASNAYEFSDTTYPDITNFVSPVQQDIVADQSNTTDTSYPAIIVRSTKSHADVMNELAAYRAANPDEQDYLN